MTQTDSQKPAKTFPVGGTITATVWRNETHRDDRTVINHSVQIQKRYFDKKDEEWKTSGSFFADDLPRIRLALAKAYEYIMMEASRGAEANGA